jgi:hypothetical protein
MKVDSGLEKLVMKLKSMSGVDEEFVPTFKFIQFRKSRITDIITNE